jgi:hypothetical protein
MAGTLTVTWNNSTPIGGPFRIAYKYPAWNGNPASAGYPISYVIINGISCATPTCSYNINLPIITDEACDPLLIEGYVQPSCEAEFSLDGRIPFSVTFTPNPVCKGVKFMNVSGTNTPAYNFGTGCEGAFGTINGALPGESFTLCYIGGVAGAAFAAIEPGLPAGYIYETPPYCCYECVELTISYDGLAGAPVRATAQCCNPAGPPITKNWSFVPGDPPSTETVCVKPNSWNRDSSTLTFTVGAVCTDPC